MTNTATFPTHKANGVNRVREYAQTPKPPKNGGVPTLRRITPQIAANWLENLHPDQRRKRQATVDGYALDMAEGRFSLTPFPVIRDTKGRLMDRRHTLEAIVQSGKPQWMWVAEGCDPKVMAVIDCGLARKISDVARAHGKMYTDSMASAVLRAVAGPNMRKTYSLRTKLALIEQHEEAAQFALEHLPPGYTRLAVAPTRAVLLRAWYTRDRKRLVEFAEVLLTGRLQDARRDSAALAIRLWIDNVWARGGRPKEQELYLKVERALQAFLDGVELGRLYQAKEELFPLPGEDAAQPQESAA